MLDFRYLAHGTATDYMFNVVRVPMSFTFEVCEMQSLLTSLQLASLMHAHNFLQLACVMHAHNFLHLLSDLWR